MHDDQMDHNTSTEPQSHASSQSGSTARPEPSDSTWGGISRRQFLTGVAAATGALAFSGGRARGQFTTALPDPDLSGIEHFVVVMQENRSFDHYLGWLPDADGIQAGLKYIDKNGVEHFTRRLQGEYRGCAHPDPTHSYGGGHTTYNGGSCDGWLQAGSNDTFAISYYGQRDLAFHGRAVPQWTTFDRYFPAILGPTFPNRIYQHAGQTDRISNTFDICQLPTIWDRLADAGLTGRYYYNDLPVLALWGVKYKSIAKKFSVFLRDCITNRLPNVSYIDPQFIGQEKGDATSDHPHADIRNGQAFLNLVYKAVTQTPVWKKTVLVMNYDEWGGFFDHVPPPAGPIPEADASVGSDGLRGFRVPCLLISPWAKKGLVSHTVYDHTSILKMIEWRFGLEPLSIRDEQANNMAEALDFSQRPRRKAPQFVVRKAPRNRGCQPQLESVNEDFEGLREHALSYGWRV